MKMYLQKQTQTGSLILFKLLIKQKLHGFLKKYFREGPANDMSCSTSVSLLTSINGISHSSIKSKTGFLTFSGGIEMWHWTKMG